eukprot:6175089-Pleurochrysis_carterae.AAC.2
MSAMRLCLDGVQTCGKIETRLSEGLPVDGRSTYLFARQNSAVGLHFPGETPNNIEVKKFKKISRCYGKKAVRCNALRRTTVRSWRLEIFPPIADTTTGPGAIRAALRAQVEINYGRYPNGQETQTCQFRHSPNQSLVAHTKSATGSDHSLDAPVVCKVSLNVYHHVSQIKGPGSEMKLSHDWLRIHWVHSGSV